MITTEDEDQGKLMVNILKSKETFKKSFMVSDFDEIVCVGVVTGYSPVTQSLGETVIGAFKHAGRRRMAFSVGTMMAEFHRYSHTLPISHPTHNLPPSSEMSGWYRKQSSCSTMWSAYTLYSDGPSCPPQHTPY